MQKLNLEGQILLELTKAYLSSGKLSSADMYNVVANEESGLRNIARFLCEKYSEDVPDKQESAPECYSFSGY